MFFRQIFDPRLAQYAYLIGCQRTGEALIVDPQRDVDRYLEMASAEGLRLTAAAETHIHADFLSGARQLAVVHGLRVYLSAEGGDDWRYRWIADADGDTDADSEREVDAVELRDGDRFSVGHVEIEACHTPGHTPEHLVYFVHDRGGGAEGPLGIASGDFVFVGDLGRPDLLESAAGESGAREPAARSLYDSALAFLDLPDHLQLWPGHGAGSACGKALGSVPTSTVGYEKRTNASLRATDRGEDGFVDAILDGQPEPPFYFGRMKRQNRQGPKILHDGLPQPRRLKADQFAAYLREHADALDESMVVVDTRRDRRAFMAGHLPASLYAPFDKSFPTVTGSYLQPGQLLVLLIDDDDVDAAVRELVRIGLDDVLATAPFEALESVELQSIDAIDFAAVDRLVAEGNGRYRIVDVRGLGEYQAAHAEGAVQVAHTRLAERLDEIPQDRELLVHCASGARAAVASAYLARQGRRVRFVDDQAGPWLSAR